MHRSENNQYLKIQVTRTTFKKFDFLKKSIIGKDSASDEYLFFIYRQCLCSKPKDNSIMIKTNYRNGVKEKLVKLGLYKRVVVCFSPCIIFAAFCSKFILVCIFCCVFE